jgi:hypothetical protein
MLIYSKELACGNFVRFKGKKRKAIRGHYQ